MRRLKRTFYLLWFLIVLGILFGLMTAVYGQESTLGYKLPEGVYIKLTEDFYRALTEESKSGTRTYGSTRSDEYLRQITVSTKFMVETNIKILEKQDKIIELLEAIRKKK